jgi:uncharacterized phage protein (TIGR02218 family)
MRTASPALIAYLNAQRALPDSQLLMADCYTVTLLNGTVLGYTNIDYPIALNGLTYVANSILVDGLKYKCSIGLDVDQQKITISAKPTDTINGVPFLVAIQNGVLDGAEIQRDRVFLNPHLSSIGSVTLFKGRVGTIDGVGRTTAEITVNSDLTLLDINMPRNLYSPACLHVLYDSGCTLLASNFETAGVVGPPSNLPNSVIEWTGANSNYAQGKITFTSGVNAGISATIKAGATSAQNNGNPAYLQLAYPLIEAPSPGDTFDVFFGCDHTMATCQTKFNNLANFRGFPFIPPPTFAA